MAKATRADFEAKYLARFRVPPATTSQPQPAASGAPAAVAPGVVSERASEYAYRILDRQINKARGLLAYNGLLFATFSLVTKGTSMPKSALILAASGSIVALVSCLPLLFLINLKWGSADMYASAEADFKATLETVWERSMWMKISLCLSIAATVGALVLSYKFLMYQIG